MPDGLAEPERVIGPGQGVPQVAHPGGGDLQQPGLARLCRAEVELALPAREPLPSGGLQRLELGVVVRGIHVLNVPRPAPRGPREDHAFWTAIAPDALFTVRTHAFRRDYEPRRKATPVVRKFRPHGQQTSWSQRTGELIPALLIKLRSLASGIQLT